MKAATSILVIAIGLGGCGTVGQTTPMTPTMSCLEKAKSGPMETRQQAMNECMWAKAHDMKN